MTYRLNGADYDANQRGALNAGRRKPARAPVADVDKSGRDAIFEELDREIAEDEAEARRKHGGGEDDG